MEGSFLVSYNYFLFPHLCNTSWRFQSRSTKIVFQISLNNNLFSKLVWIRFQCPRCTDSPRRQLYRNQFINFCLTLFVSNYNISIYTKIRCLNLTHRTICSTNNISLYIKRTFPSTIKCYYICSRIWMCFCSISITRFRIRFFHTSYNTSIFSF